MIARAVPSWQLLLADLSLILFISTAAALAHAEEAAAEQQETGAPVSGAPLAVLRGEGAGTDGQLLADWLAGYSADPREQLTLKLYYAPGTFPAAQERLASLQGLAQEAGYAPRMILEQGEVPALHASFAFDQSASLAPDVARNLQP